MSFPPCRKTIKVPTLQFRTYPTRDLTMQTVQMRMECLIAVKMENIWFGSVTPHCILTTVQWLKLQHRSTVTETGPQHSDWKLQYRSTVTEISGQQYTVVTDFQDWNFMPAVHWLTLGPKIPWLKLKTQFCDWNSRTAILQWLKIPDSCIVTKTAWLNYCDWNSRAGVQCLVLQDRNLL